MNPWQLANSWAFAGWDWGVPLSDLGLGAPQAQGVRGLWPDQTPSQTSVPSAAASNSPSRCQGQPEFNLSTPAKIRVGFRVWFFGILLILHFPLKNSEGKVQKSKVSKFMSDYESCVGVPMILTLKCQTSRVWQMFIREFGFTHYNIPKIPNT